MERDDIIEYSLDTHHSEEQGKKIRRKIWLVTAILTVITAFEVGVGMTVHQDSPSWWIVKLLFIGLTLLKAGYIVLVFMHLGDEKKVLKYFILVPYALFVIYLIFIALTEALAINSALEQYGG
ncbi:MAG: cytochrome C oxidase subunit IV family protein [Bacteroidota bacterium]